VSFAAMQSETRRCRLCGARLRGDPDPRGRCPQCQAIADAAGRRPERAQAVTSSPSDKTSPSEAIIVDRWAAALTLPTLYEQRAELQRQRALQVGQIADIERRWRTTAIIGFSLAAFALGLLVLFDGLGITAGIGVLALLGAGAVAWLQLPEFISSATATPRGELDRVKRDLARVDAAIAKAQRTVNS
jgi:hypothetical protein